MSQAVTSLFPLSDLPVIQVALPLPLRQTFDYVLPPTVGDAPLGVRVRVPFGHRQLIGIVTGHGCQDAAVVSKLKSVAAVLDPMPCLSPTLFAMGLWAAAYYQHPVGEVLTALLPLALRDGGPVWPVSRLGWCMTASAHEQRSQLQRSARQRALYDWCVARGGVFSREDLLSAGFAVSHAAVLVQRGILEKSIPPPVPLLPRQYEQEALLPLSDEQQLAVESVALGRFGAWLLEGVTGSGKTEVYLQLIGKVLAQGKQALVLVPEIGLTPQTVNRFRRRFGCPVVVLHSGLSEGERLAAWCAAERGEAGIVIGTRSAIFTPLARPGILIVDEEHDSSFKQHDGFRYSARNLAVWRAHHEALPVVLGSATPSLETLYNAINARYQHLRLTHRAAGATPPSTVVVDMRGKQATEGFSTEALLAMREELGKGQQVLVFLNRRGFAPALVCADCGWIAVCKHCSARMTVHRSTHLLRCHHCDARESLVQACPVCQSARLDFVGLGTQRSEQFLEQQFSEVPVWRIDRDSISHRQPLDMALQQIRAGRSGILLGTQMLAKGHHFPDVTLVVMLDIDQGLFSSDFRSAEKMGQLLEQVAGRAGRADKPGRVLIQSRYADHPLLVTLLRKGYHHLARTLLAERQASGLPPYAFMAVLRVEQADPMRCQQVLEACRNTLLELGADASLQVVGPFPASLERRSGVYRYDLEIRSIKRTVLQTVLSAFCLWMEQKKWPAGIRWSIDVDPVG